MTENRDIRQLALGTLGFASLNEMQEKMLSLFPEGRDILLLAPTGSGKTLAFLLPLWEAEGKTLIIAPSRELVQQIADVWQRLHTEIRCVACYGGHDTRAEQQQLQALLGEQGAQDKYLIVGTPGRLKDHIERGNIKPEGFTFLVIDEFDKSLELGFEEEMHAILDTLTGIQQRIFTSATHAIPIAPWTGFHNYAQLDFGSDQKEPERLTIYQVKSPIADKLETLHELLLCLLGKEKEGTSEQAIVFANYREAAERDKSIIRLRGGSISVLISTDLASRGLDLPDVSHIIHYHFPQSPEAYTHRNGRTARAGASGTAYVIVGPEEVLPEYFPAKLPFYSTKKHPDSIGPAPMVTVYIGRGKKEKISKGDVVGFFTKNGGLTGADLGRIDVMDHCAYVAIRRDKAEAALAKVKGLKIKGEKTHYRIVTGS